MKTFKFKFLSLLMAILVFSCSDPEDPTTPPTDPGSGNPTPGQPVALANTAEVFITLPEGAAFDLSKSTLSSGLMTFPVTADGKSKIVLPDSVTRVAYLFDEANNLVLMGLIHAGSKTIDAESTAQALFYLGSGIYFYPKEVVDMFLNPGMELPGYADFKTKVSQGLKQNTLYLENLAFEQDLKTLLDEYQKAPEILDIRSRQINVDPAGFQSGIQIFENDAQTLKIANTYRRRAHAFFYKTGYKAKGSKEEIILKPTISFGEKTGMTQEIEPTAAFSSTLGTIVDQIMGKGIEYARKETDPIPLPLKDDEDEAIYKVRVIGTSLSNSSTTGMTEDELKMWEKLMAKQLYLDFVAPILTEMFSEVKGAQDATFGLEAFEFFLSQAPLIWDLVEKGDWKKATQETIKYLVVDKAGQEFQKKFIEKVVDKYKNLNSPTWIDLDRDYNNASASAKYVKIIKAVELTVKLLDMAKLTTEIAISNKIDVFTAKAIRSDVKINPASGSVVPFTNFALTAESKTELSAGQSFVYKWKTTGTYGIISSGNQKAPEIETSSKTVNFRSEKKPADLGENNYETVTVEVYIKQGTSMTFVGEGKSVINVKKLKLVMKPNDITLDGKKKQSVRLYLERTDYVNDIISTPNLEYKVEWSTSGAYGKFDGQNKNATTRGNSINYQALDDKIKEGIETITARVYFKSPDSDWTLREEVTGKVKVVNDPNKIVLDVALVTKEWNLSDATKCNLGVNMMALVPVHPKAIRYTVKFYGFKKSSTWENRTSSWVPGQTPPVTYGFPGAGPNQIVGDNYYFTIGRRWGSGPGSSSCGSQLAGYHEEYKAYGGRANIVIEITD
ncbi:hypothetical protein [Algoriphagus litoralis]|uniref:hypothetical protein n=1 Tax=Algoriphagus litoralis TaxID=2202829 RepID=UPI000DB9B71E|nr:hypothetical protein [Algoriphagus litoralis]